MIVTAMRILHSRLEQRTSSLTADEELPSQADDYDGDWKVRDELMGLPMYDLVTHISQPRNRDIYIRVIRIAYGFAYFLLSSFVRVSGVDFALFPFSWHGVRALKLARGGVAGEHPSRGAAIMTIEHTRRRLFKPDQIEGVGWIGGVAMTESLP